MQNTGPAHPLAEQHQPSLTRSDWIPILLAVSIFSAASIYEAIASQGFLEADSITHFSYARFAFTETHYLINIWGRPLVTGLYALPAYFFGRMGVRITSLLLALTCGFVACTIAKGQKHRAAALAMIMTFAQPLVFLHSFSELTELPFAALIGLAFLAYQRRQFALMTILCAISPLARPEGFAFLLLALIAVCIHNRGWWILILPIPLLVWSYKGWAVYGSPVYPSNLPASLHWLLWLSHEWPYAAQSMYGSGSILHFVGLMPAVTSPLVFPATCVGVWCCTKVGASLSRDSASDPRDRHRAVCEILIVIIPLLILGGHSILYFTGRMASSGEMRYLLVVAPFWGVLSARGWTWIFGTLHWQRPLRWAALAATVPMLVNLNIKVGDVHLGYGVLPLHLQPDMIIARRIARWYNIWALRSEYPCVAAAHPGVYYFMDISQTQKDQSRQWTKQTVTDAPPGTILIWDPMFGVLNADANRTITRRELEDAGWVLEEEATELLNDPDTEEQDCWMIWLSPQGRSGMETQ